MIYVNSIVIVLCLFMLASNKINTYTMLKMLGLGLIIIGAIINLDNKHNFFIELGVLSYLICDCLNAYLRKRNTRASDKLYT